jgi:hypothetical protein
MRSAHWVCLGLLGLAAGSAGDLPAIAQDRPAAVRVRVVTPPGGASATAYPVLIRGVVEPPDPDVRVTVDSRPAFVVQRGGWATLRALPPGTHDLLVEARARGQVASTTRHRITVEGAPPGERPAVLKLASLAARPFEHQVLLRLAPFEWAFRLDAESGIAEGRLDPDGTGGRPVELRLGDVHTHVFRSPGLYGPTLRYVDGTGRTVTQQALVIAFDRTWLEPLLQARWAEFLAAVAEDPARAVRLVDATRRRYYSVMVQAAEPADLPKWAPHMAGWGPLVLDRVEGRAAVCTFKNLPDHPEVEFVLDPTDGRWYYYFR